jgi:hypothetical protein
MDYHYLTSLINVAFNAHLQILVERDTKVNPSQFYTAKNNMNVLPGQQLECFFLFF